MDKLILGKNYRFYHNQGKYIGELTKPNKKLEKQNKPTLLQLKGGYNENKNGLY